MTNTKEGDHRKLCDRFGTIAVDKGFITAEDLQRGIQIQVQEDLEGKKHRVIGGILFDLGLITHEKIDEVLKGLFQQEGNS
jgi:hypothetical protein